MGHLVGLHLAADVAAREVALQDDVGLGVRVVVPRAVDLERLVRGELSERVILAQPHRQGVELGGGGEDLEQPLELGPRLRCGEIGRDLARCRGGMGRHGGMRVRLVPACRLEAKSSMLVYWM